jgi:hypothetical protein
MNLTKLRVWIPWVLVMDMGKFQEQIREIPLITTSGGRDDEINESEGDYIQQEEDEEEGEDEDENKKQSEIEYNDFDEFGGDDLAASLTEGTEVDLPRPHRTDWPHSLFTSLRVYVMADKFDVPALKLLACKRFSQTAEKIYMTCEDFPAVVDEMYRNTPPNDIAMREIPCRLIANQYYEDKALRERVEPVMREHGDLAVGVSNCIIYYMKVLSPPPLQK